MANCFLAVFDYRPCLLFSPRIPILFPRVFLLLYEHVLLYEHICFTAAVKLKCYINCDQLINSINNLIVLLTFQTSSLAITCCCIRIGDLNSRR